MSMDHRPPPYRQPLPVTAQREWRNAPPIVKGWAYPLTWLAIVVFPILIAVVLVNGDLEAAGRLFLGGLYSCLFVLSIWLNRALKRGLSAAWVVQLVMSVLGLLGFPIGTLIHGYILSQWFKPETKAWFGQL
jgi:hypothetical protein